MRTESSSTVVTTSELDHVLIAEKINAILGGDKIIP